MGAFYCDQKVNDDQKNYLAKQSKPRAGSFGILTRSDAPQPIMTDSGHYSYRADSDLGENVITIQANHSSTPADKYFDIARFECLQAGDRLKVIAYYSGERIWANYFTHLFADVVEAWPEAGIYFEPWRNSKPRTQERDRIIWEAIQNGE